MLGVSPPPFLPCVSRKRDGGPRKGFVILLIQHLYIFGKMENSLFCRKYGDTKFAQTVGNWNTCSASYNGNDERKIFRSYSDVREEKGQLEVVMEKDG